VCGFSPVAPPVAPPALTGGGSVEAVMAKLVLSAALTAALLRVVDGYFFLGKYTDSVLLMVSDMLRWFGV
jgi:hypothetical protein